MKERCNIIILPLPSEDYCLIDSEDYYKIKQYSWCKQGHGYVHAWIKGKYIKLHRFLTNPPKNLQVDHINRDKLDNRKSNLRFVNNRENSSNRTIHGLFPVGVIYIKDRGKFRTQIKYKGQTRFIRNDIDHISGKILYDFVREEIERLERL